MPGGPANRARIGTGDRILELNDVATTDHPLELFEDLVSSAPRLDLRVEPWNDRSPPFAVSIERSRVQNQPPDYGFGVGVARQIHPHRPASQ